MSKRMGRRVAAVSVAGAAIACAAGALAQAPLPTPRSVRITMEALHAAGGVPPGWELALQPGDVKGGRQLFIEQGCVSCHVVQGANLPAVPPAERQIGPELTGMGAHHPPVYFLEAIVNPNAVLVEGPGYISAAGRSTMPAYPDLTVAQLQDLIAFLSSLTTGGDAACHAPVAITPGAGPPPTNVAAPLAPTPAVPLPAPPSVAGSVSWCRPTTCCPTSSPPSRSGSPRRSRRRCAPSAASSASRPPSTALAAARR